MDLVESGRIMQSELDRANVKCREVYRPVLIARDGEMLVDDVGGVHGFADFLQKVNPELKGMSPEEKEDARREKKEYLEWARSLGWHRDKATDFNLLCWQQGRIRFLPVCRLRELMLHDIRRSFRSLIRNNAPFEMHEIQFTWRATSGKE